MTVTSYPMSRGVHSLGSRRRIRGAITAMWVAAPVSAILIIIAVFSWFLVIAALIVQLTAALMGAMVAGWGRLRSAGRRPRLVVIVMTAGSVLLGALLVATTMVLSLAIGGHTEPGADPVTSVLGLATMGLAALGRPLLGLALLHAWAWAGLMRR